MDDQNTRLKRLIFEYRKKGNPTLLRNKIYEILQKDLLVILKGILHKQGRFLEKSEIISLSFDCFLFFLESYNERYRPLPHLRRYTAYYLKSHFSEKQTKEDKIIRIDDPNLFGSMEPEQEGELSVKEKIKKLIDFRNNLPNEEEKMLFDRAVTGKEAGTKELRDLRKKMGLSYYQTVGTIWSFKKIVIPFLLRREEI